MLVALAGFAGMLAITLLGNMPLNRRIEAATSDTNPEHWWTLRRRWDALHRYRVPLEIAAFTALVTGVLLAR